MGTPSRATVSELPPYRALLAVDVKDFSGIPGRHHAAVTEEIPRILRDAFTRGGIRDIWDERLFTHSTGDGLAAGFRSGVLPFLLNPLLKELQNELRYRNDVGGARTVDSPIRMRVSITVGPVTEPGGEGTSDGSGASRVELHRLLDAEPVRDLLTRSSPATTYVAAIISARAFEDAVVSGYAGEDESLYLPAPVGVKTYQGTAYLRVPNPSGDLIARGFLPSGTPGAEKERRRNTPGVAVPPPTTINSIGTVSGAAKVNQGGVFHDHSTIGIGSIHGGVERVVTNPQGPVNVGEGDQINLLGGEQHARDGRGR